MKPFIFVGASVLLLAACGHQASQSSQTDVQGKWTVSDIIHLQELPNNQPTLEFTTDRVSGNTGCNNVMGTYKVEGNQLTFSNLATTRKLCSGPQMEQERSLLDLLAKPLTIEKDDKNLLLKNGSIRVLTLTPN